MASLLERMNISNAQTGPIRSKSSQSLSRSAGPYNRNDRTPKGDVESQWSHDLFESHNSLSARLSNIPTAPKANISAIAQKALRDATSTSRPEQQLNIKGASTISQGNVVDVTGLAAGTTAEDVVAIFKRCGTISNAKSLSNGEDVRIRVTFKVPASATAAVQKFHNQPADGKVLSVRVVGNTTAGTTLGGRLGGVDGLGLVRDEGSVDILMDLDDNNGGSKMRSDSLLHMDPRAHVLVAPPGANPTDYTKVPDNRGRGGRGRGPRRGRRGGYNGEGRMMTD